MITRKVLAALFVLTLFTAISSGAMVHRYSFTSDASDSIGTANGALMGDASISSGAVQLDGDGDYVNLPGGAIAINGFSSITFEAWWTHDDQDSWQRVFDFGAGLDGSGGQCVFFTPTSGNNTNRLAISNDKPSYTGGGEEQAEGSGKLATGSYHMAGVVDVTNGQLRYYLNGSPVDSVTLTKTISGLSNDYALLGRALYNDPYLDGSIDEFRIYNTALTNGEVLASFNAGPDVPEPATMSLLALGGLCVLRRRRRRC
jgi:hypothetical protein